MSTSLEATVAMLARQVVMLERQVSALMLRRGAPFAPCLQRLAVMGHARTGTGAGHLLDRRAAGPRQLPPPRPSCIRRRA